jgi:DNA-binding SARP family transcriptional activator
VDLGILGPFEVCIDRGPPIALGGVRQQALLALLALHANEVVSTDRLVDELWGEEPPPTAVHTVQVFVSRLRRALGAASERLITRPPGYAFELAIDELDAARCEHLYASARAALAGSDAARSAALLHDAKALWRGPPLCEFNYEGFAQAEIARLQELRMSCREELIEAELALGEHASLVPELEALVREQPFRERTRGQLMLALYRSGRQADALDAFQQARHKLIEELGVEPSGSLRELEQAILRQDPSIAAPPIRAAAPDTPVSQTADLHSSAGATAYFGPPPLPPLLRSAPTTAYVGRDTEEQLTDRAVEDVCGGSRRFVVIGGEPGVGKTRLAARTALKAHARGLAISWATAVEDMSAPYAIWLAILSHLIEHAPRQLVESLAAEHGGELVRLVPSLGDRVDHMSPVRKSDPETERYLMFQAVIALLEALTSAIPIVLVLDDLQWADAPSLALLEHVAGATGHLPLLIIATYRDSEMRADHPLADTLAGLHRLDGVHRLTLRGLSPDETISLMAAIMGHEMGAPELELAAEIAGETDGNPFFVVQILRHLHEHGVISPDESGRWNARLPGELTLPPSVREVVARRVGRLGSRPQAILMVAAVAGEAVDLELLERIVDDREEDVLDALEGAVRASVLVESTEIVGRFNFAHALFRHSLYEELGATRRARIHRQVAEAIEDIAQDDVGDRVTELAHHWIAARAEPRKAVAYAQLAGETALKQLAPDDALRWFAEALAVLPQDDDHDATRCELLIGLGEARRQVGDASFRDCLLEASALAERLDDPERMTRAVVANTLGPFGAAGPPDHERIRALRRTLERLPADSADVPLVRAITAKEIYYGGDPDGGVELGEEALSLARRGSDRRALARVMSFTAAISPIAPLEHHAARVEELVRLGEEFADPELQFRAANLRFLHSMHSGDREELEAALAVMLRLADSIGQPVLRWTALWTHSAQEWIRGDLAAAERLTMDAAAVARAHSIPDGLLITFGQLLAIRTEQDRLDEVVEPLIRQAERNPSLRVLQLARGFVDAERGHLTEAAAVLAELAREGYAFAFDRTRAFNLARSADIALRVGDLDSVPRLYEALIAHRTQFATPAGVSSRGSIELNLGRLASALGRYEAADGHLEAALHAHSRFAAPLLEARAHLAVGESLVARNDPAHASRAIEALNAAAALAREHGSTAIGREATALLTEQRLRASSESIRR